MELWHILLTLGIVAFIFEIFTAGFIAGSVGIGFFFAAAGSYFGLNAKWQILLFSVGVLLTFFLIRPFIMKVGFKEKIRTNADALPGKTGRVTEEIDPAKNTGRVSIDGDDWKAIPKDHQIIKAGTVVRVVDIDSITLIVEPLN